jgi:hypothetical protein
MRLLFSFQMSVFRCQTFLVFLLATGYWLLATTNVYAQTPTVNPTGSPCKPGDSPTREERAVYNLNETIPDSTIRTNPPQAGFLSIITNFLARIIELFSPTGTPCNLEKYYLHSQSREQSTIPKEAIHQPKADVVENLKDYVGVGSSAGVYSGRSPFFPDITPTEEGYARLYQNANFPAGTHVIVPPAPTPTLAQVQNAQ